MKYKLIILLSILTVVIFSGCRGQNNSGTIISTLSELEKTVENAVINVHENIVLTFVNQENIRNLSNQLHAARENYALYEDYIEQIYDFRENKVGETHYAAYDRYCFYDLYSFPQGYSEFFSDGNDCIGIRMALRSEEQFDEKQEAREYSYYSEYYELDELTYVSFSQTDYSTDLFQIPNFMCMKDMEYVKSSGLGEEYWTTFTLNGSGVPDIIEEIVISDSINTPQWEFLRTEDDTIYKIAMKGKALFEMQTDTGSKEVLSSELSSVRVYTDWLINQCYQCERLLVENSIPFETILDLIPDGYKMLSTNDYTIADMNNDGINDILFTIFPQMDNYEDLSDFEDWSPYHKVYEYYYQELWILWGQNDGGYREECIMESITWDDTYSHIGNKGFTGGFLMEYFVGRAPFETVLHKYVYNLSTGRFTLEKVYQNDGYHEGFAIYTPLIFGDVYTLELPEDNDRIYHHITVEDYVNSKYHYLLNEYGYTEYGSVLFLQNKDVTDQINKNLEKEVDRIFLAIEELGECPDVSFGENGVVFLNSKIVVIEFEVLDYTLNGEAVRRRIPITIDLSTGEIIDYLDYITKEELEVLCACIDESNELTFAETLQMLISYNDYSTLLASGKNSLTMRICQEGLLIYNTAESWPDYYLIPRSKLINSPLASFWDDWP